MELRGYDSYKITLGDEMRGERATLGKSLDDVADDLKIRPRLVAAIENSDLSGFPNQSMIPGHVRSYARYLKLDAEHCYQRFCEESGFRSPAAMMSEFGDDRGFGEIRRTPIPFKQGVDISKSRFAAPPVTNRFRATIPLGAITSALALAGLIAGLGYGGYKLLQDIQRVGFAPLPDAPVVIADAPEIDAPLGDVQNVKRPAAEDYHGGGLLAAHAAQAVPQTLETPRRDGPISAIDPETAGVFANLRAPELPRMASHDPMGDLVSTRRALEVAEIARGRGPLIGPAADQPIPVVAEAAPAAPQGTIIHATEDAWVRVRTRNGATLFEGILTPGQTFALPDRVDDPIITTGNAGGTYVSIDGALFGPFGRRGRVVKNASLMIDAVREAMPAAEMASILPAPPADEPEQQAEASLTRP